MTLSIAEVRRRMLEKIDESMLTAADARRLQFTPFVQSPPAIKLPASGFAIPYYDIHKEPTNFYRYRYLEQPARNGFKALTQTKLFKYTQPAEAGPEAYFSLLFDWERHLAVQPLTLHLTEGELKADCACKLGIPCVGLGGVWNWRKDGRLLPELAALNYTDAQIWITFDSDALSNFQILQAENALAKDLIERGAAVYIVRIPPLAPEKKTGLDDYLKAEGPATYAELVANTRPWPVSRELHQLNSEVTFVHDPGMVVEVDSMQVMSTTTFTTGVYANRIWLETTFVVDKNKKVHERIVRKSAATEWIKWPHRSEVKRLVYQPGYSREMPETRELNTWVGWGVSDKYIKSGDIALWHQFMKYFFYTCPPQNRQWAERWLAAPLQQPGLKMYSAIVAHSVDKGSGKSLLGHTMRRIYGKNYSEINEKQLAGQFNEWAQNKQFVMAEEIAGGDKRGTADLLKAMITQPTVIIDAKYKPTYVIDDCINYYFTSNHPDSFYVEDGDRRLFVHELKCGPLMDLDAKFVVEYDRWYRTPEAAGALFYYFLNLDMGDFNPKAPALETSAKRSMVEAGRSDIGAWVVALRDTPEQIMAVRTGLTPEGGYKFMTTEEIYNYWERVANNQKLTKPGLSREMRRAQFEQVNKGEPVWSKAQSKTVRLWVVRGDYANLEGLTDPLARAKQLRKERATLALLSAGAAAAEYDRERKVR